MYASYKHIKQLVIHYTHFEIFFNIKFFSIFKMLFMNSFKQFYVFTIYSKKYVRLFSEAYV